MRSLKILMAASALMLAPMAAHAQTGQPHTQSQAATASQPPAPEKPASAPAASVDASGKPPAPQQAAPNTTPDKPA